MSAETYPVQEINNCLDHTLSAEIQYVGRHVSSAEILNCCGLTRLQWGYIYAGQHAFSAEILNVWWLT